MSARPIACQEESADASASRRRATTAGKSASASSRWWLEPWRVAASSARSAARSAASSSPRRQCASASSAAAVGSSRIRPDRPMLSTARVSGSTASASGLLLQQREPAPRLQLLLDEVVAPGVALAIERVEDRERGRRVVREAQLELRLDEAVQHLEDDRARRLDERTPLRQHPARLLEVAEVDHELGADDPVRPRRRPRVRGRRRVERERLLRPAHRPQRADAPRRVDRGDPGGLRRVADVGQPSVRVVHAHDERVERAAAGLRRRLRLAVGVVVDEAQQVADDVGLGAARRHRDDLARVVDPPEVPEAPGHHAAAQRRRAGEAVALARARQPVGDPRAAAEVLERDRQHELRRREAVGRRRRRARARAAIARRRRSPAARRRAGWPARPRASASSGAPARSSSSAASSWWPSVSSSSPCARRSSLHLGRRPPAEALDEVLAEPRVRAHAAAVLLPGHREVPGTQADEQLARAGDAERLRPFGGDLVEHGGHLQQLALGRSQARQDLRREVAVQRVGLAADALDVVGRPPGLEEHAGHPAAGVGDGARRVDARPPGALEGLRRLLGRERQRRLADGRDAADRAAVAEVDADVRAAEQRDPQASRARSARAPR